MTVDTDLVPQRREEEEVETEEKKHLGKEEEEEEKGHLEKEGLRELHQLLYKPSH